VYKPIIKTIFMLLQYKNFTIRDWQPNDRSLAAEVIRQVLTEYGLPWQPDLADQDVLNIESYYQQTGGVFWVVTESDHDQNNHQNKIVGTAAYYPIDRQEQLTDRSVEIRKMYLLPAVRGKGLGKFLLTALEKHIIDAGFNTIWIETASILKEAVILYEKNGYQPTSGVETARCDRIYVKKLSNENYVL
jgi:putative acetyltransferase